MLDRVRAWLFPSSCVGCDRPGPALCAACAPPRGAVVRFAVDGVPGFALGPYDGVLRRAVVTMKRGERDPLDAFAALLAERAPFADAIVPLPTSRVRAAERGFDQSVEIARRVAAASGAQCADVLTKRGPAQAHRSRVQRLAAARRFALRDGATLPRRATLVDDVLTTGATARDAIRVLADAGVVVAGVVVVARTPPARAGTFAEHAGSVLTV